MGKKRLWDKRISINETMTVWREIDGEILVLNKKERSLYEMNDAAGFIWREAAKKKKKIADIFIALRNKYKTAEKEGLGEDLLCFVETLIKEKYFKIEGSNG
jgi:hypothetical protein